MDTNSRLFGTEMKTILLTISLLLFGAGSAFAQPGPGPTPSPWVVNGNVMSPVGSVKVNLTPSSSSYAGLNLGCGATPTSPINGDFWCTTAGVFVQINGATIGPLTQGAGASFTGVAPIVVSFPSSVVTYSLNYDSSLIVSSTNLGINPANTNIFTVVQGINTNASPLGAALTGSLFHLAQADTVIGRVQLDTYGSTSGSPAPAEFTGLAYGGTGASPTQTPVGAPLVRINAYAYTGSAVVGAIGSFEIDAAEAIASGHQGSYACVKTTVIASTTLTPGFCQENDGSISVGAPTGSSHTGSSTGAGTINVAGGYYVNGGQIAVGNLASISANRIVGQTAAGAPVALMINGGASCLNALIWTNGTGFGCNTLAGTGTVSAGGGGIVPTSGSPPTLFQEQMPLGGRLTLISGTCVATTDQAAQTTIYYAPCGGGKYLPIYDGSNMELHQFTASDTDQVGLSIALGSNWAANTLFDVYVTLSSSVVTICTVPWTSSGAGSSARATAVTQYKGIWANNASMTCRTTNSATITVAQYQGTLVGTFLTNGSTGTVDLKFGTNASNGGYACICIWNVYNQVQGASAVGDTTASWTYTTATFREANGSTTNQINIVQGLASQPINVTVLNIASNSGTNGVFANGGIGIDSTTSDSSQLNIGAENVVAAKYGPATAYYSGVLAVGYHNVNRLEQAQATGTETWLGFASVLYQTGIRASFWY